MNLTRQPVRQREGKPAKDAAYLGKVARLPCCVCDAYGEQQLSRTTVHHPIMDRNSMAKRPDRTAIPLCDGHHQGDFDTSKIAIHREPAAWREAYGADHEYIEITQDAVERMEADFA